MGDNIGHNYAANHKGFNIGGDDERHARELRRPVWNRLEQRDADQVDAVGVAGAERQLAEHAHERILGSLLVFGLHAEVIDSSGSIGIDNRFGPAPAQGFAGDGHHEGIQISKGEVVGNRRRRDIQVNVGFGTRRQIRARLEHAHARNGQVIRQESEESRVRIGVAVGNGVEVPLVGYAQDDYRIGVVGDRDGVGAQQFRLSARALIEHYPAGEAGGIGKAVADGGHQRLVDGYDQRAGIEGKGVGDEPVTAGDDERIILADIVGLGRDGIDVHAVAGDGDGIIGTELPADAEGRREEDILYVVHRVNVGNQIGVPGQVEVVAGGNVVAEIDEVRIVEVGDDQIQVIDQLDAGDWVPGRVSPDQRNAQGQVTSSGGEGKLIGAALPGGQSVGRVLIDHDH